MPSVEYYLYVKGSLLSSGIDFKNIPLENILVTCSQYRGKISKENYNTVLNVIKDIYESRGNVWEGFRN